MHRYLFAGVIALLFTVGPACTNEEAARSTLEAQGFTDIELTGHAWNECSDSDATCTGFKARSPSGRRVEGAVGCGRSSCGKGCTVRLDQ